MVEAINAYIRLLNLDNKQLAVQEKLIEALYFHEDYQAVVQLSDWYYEKAMFNERVHYLLFRSYKIKSNGRSFRNSKPYLKSIS